MRGITAPAAIEAMTATTIIPNSALLAYRNSAKYPTVNLGASICLSIISLSCSLRPAIGALTSSPCFSSTDDDAGDRVVMLSNVRCVQVCSIVVP
jgi:hypothetical protein